MNRRRKDKQKTSRGASIAFSKNLRQRSEVGLFETSFERGQEVLEAAFRALKSSSIDVARSMENIEKQPVSPLAVMAPPDNPQDRIVFGAAVTAEIYAVLTRRLTPADHALVHSERPFTPAQVLRLDGLLDKVLIECAQTLGWRIYLSPVVQLRMAYWHDKHNHGAERIKSLGEAVHLATLVASGDAKLPVTDPELRRIKPQAVNELRRLIRQSRSTFNPRRIRPNDQEVCEWFRKTIEDSPRAFPFWWSNADSLLQYFQRAQTCDHGFVQRIVLGEVAPARLFDEWGADIHNLSPETFRQAISKLPASKL